MLIYVDSHFVVVVALYNERASHIISTCGVVQYSANTRKEIYSYQRTNYSLDWTSVQTNSIEWIIFLMRTWDRCRLNRDWFFGIMMLPILKWMDMEHVPGGGSVFHCTGHELQYLTYIA